MKNLARGTIPQHRAQRTPTEKQSPLKMSHPKKKWSKQVQRRGSRCNKMEQEQK